MFDQGTDKISSWRADTFIYYVIASIIPLNPKIYRTEYIIVATPPQISRSKLCVQNRCWLCKKGISLQKACIFQTIAFFVRWLLIRKFSFDKSSLPKDISANWEERAKCVLAYKRTYCISWSTNQKREKGYLLVCGDILRVAFHEFRRF